MPLTLKEDAFLFDEIERELSQIKASDRFLKSGLYQLRTIDDLKIKIRDNFDNILKYLESPLDNNEQELFKAFLKLKFTMSHDVKLGAEQAKAIAQKGSLLPRSQSGNGYGMRKSSDPDWHKNFVFFNICASLDQKERNNVMQGNGFFLDAQNTNLFTDGVVSFFDVNVTRSDVGVGNDGSFREVFNNKKTQIEVGHYLGDAKLCYKVNGKAVISFENDDIFYGPTIKMAMAIAMIAIVRHCDEDLRKDLYNACHEGDSQKLAKYFDEFFKDSIEAKIPGEVVLNLDPATIPTGRVSAYDIDRVKQDQQYYSSSIFD